jgi:group II intron reverse transcriptase/maturase
VRRKMTEAPEPEDKLDAATATVGVVNGPEDATLDWHQVDWRAVEASVRRLRQRIFTASQAEDLKKVRSLQKLMLRSRANTLLSVRRVTERNAGRLTAGVDEEVVLTPEAKMRLVERMQHSAEAFKAQPVRRVYIPKPGSRKRRALGIPVILDRCHQARVANALEPEWEARFEPRSYGCRPGRGCHDAIQAVYEVVKGRRPKRLWALDADLAGAFDRIAHDHILTMLGTFPARGMIRQWLKAGVVEQGRLHRTEEGTPQGGVVSPVLLNVALHGMEKVAGARYTTGKQAGRIMSGCPVLIRYSDDFVVLCHSRQEAFEVKDRLAGWLTPRGLAFNEEKTCAVTLDEGFDYLGCVSSVWRWLIDVTQSNVSSSLPAGGSPVRVAAREPGSRLAVRSGNGPGRSPASRAPQGGGATCQSAALCEVCRVVRVPAGGRECGGAEPGSSRRRPWKGCRSWKCSPDGPPGVRGVEWQEGNDGNWRGPLRPGGSAEWLTGASSPYNRHTGKWGMSRKGVGGGRITACSRRTTKPSVREGPLLRSRVTHRERLVSASDG